MNDKKIFAYSTDIIIFSIDSRKNENTRGLSKKYFSILLVKRDKEPFKDKWCLPGGFVNIDENSLEASNRILKKETNLKDIYIEQLYVFDDINRDPRGRVISNAYMALIDKTLLKDNLSDKAKWFDIEIVENKDKINIKLSNIEEILVTLSRKIKDNKTNEYLYKIEKNNSLAFDHALIINKGINVLRDKANNTDIIFNLMPELFTIGELKQVYELIQGKKLINSAFRRVIGKKVECVNEKIKTGGHRPSKLYKYK